MISDAAVHHCGKCGAALSGYAPDGLCAACLLESAFEEQDAGTGGPLKPGPLLKFADYEVLEEIARGGMGVVYRARQISLNRIVAIKMILGGHLANAAEMQRFRAEAETAAHLQHPNIVAIHEVGEHAGQPFFAMDLIAGRNLAELVRDGPLPSRRAASYLKTIAEAVQYAHSRGVLHRDLKPSNILIDDSDQPRITDFGLAKRMVAQASPPASSGGVSAARSDADSGRGRPENPQAGTPALHELTQTGQLLGSPSFIPPEQAAGQKDAIGPASDVYSLGAILYHLLTGRPPFVAETLTATLRMVAENEAVSPRLLNASVPRDLETICLKCLEKETSRRYATAQELADELGRFLRDEPIQGRPAGQTEKAWRWCRRKPALASAIVLVLVLLLVVGIGSPIAAFRINRERGFAVAASQRSQLVLEFFESKVLAATRPEGQEGGLGHDVTVRAAVEAAESSIGGSFAKEPLVEASIREVLGTTYHHLGLAERALAQHQRCLDLRRQHLGAEHPDTVTALNWLAEDFRIAGKPGAAIPLLEEGLETGRKIWGPIHTNTFCIMNDLGLVYGDAGRMDDSIALLEETLKLRRKHLGPDDPQTMVSVHNLGHKYREVGRDQEALPLIEQSVALARKQLTTNHPDTLTMMNNLGLALSAVGEFERALAIHREVLMHRQRVLGPDHDFTLGSMIGVAAALRDLGRFQEAFELAQKTAERSREVLGTNHLYTITFFNILALAAEDAGHTNEALRLSDETFNQRREALGPDHPDTLRAMSYLARARLRSGQLAEAEAFLREAEKRWRATAPANRLLAAAILPSLVECLVKLSRHDDAEKLAREYLTLAAKGSLRPWSKAEASGLLGAALLAQGRWAQAEPPLADALSDLQTNYTRVPAHIGPRLRQSLGGWLLEYSRESGRSELVEKWRRWTNAVSEAKQ